MTAKVLLSLHGRILNPDSVRDYGTISSHSVWQNRDVPLSDQIASFLYLWKYEYAAETDRFKDWKDFLRQVYTHIRIDVTL